MEPYPQEGFSVCPSAREERAGGWVVFLLTKTPGGSARVLQGKGAQYGWGAWIKVTMCSVSLKPFFERIMESSA